eukprot:c10063_g1_i1.p1 GENE.c10063_g1_i1~~c10063_g1_i1.p1  ORF type:complete len:666 (-),score=170.76 c10063_g1_i1:19-2016(-)
MTLTPLPLDKGQQLVGAAWITPSDSTNTKHIVLSNTQGVSVVDANSLKVIRQYQVTQQSIPSLLVGSSLHTLTSTGSLTVQSIDKSSSKKVSVNVWKSSVSCVAFQSFQSSNETFTVAVASNGNVRLFDQKGNDFGRHQCESSFGNVIFASVIRNGSESHSQLLLIGEFSNGKHRAQLISFERSDSALQVCQTLEFHLKTAEPITAIAVQPFGLHLATYSDGRIDVLSGEVSAASVHVTTHTSILTGPFKSVRLCFVDSDHIAAFLATTDREHHCKGDLIVWETRFGSVRESHSVEATSAVLQLTAPPTEPATTESSRIFALLFATSAFVVDVTLSSPSLLSAVGNGYLPQPIAKRRKTKTQQHTDVVLDGSILLTAPAKEGSVQIPNWPKKISSEDPWNAIFTSLNDSSAKESIHVDAVNKAMALLSDSDTKSNDLSFAHRTAIALAFANHKSLWDHLPTFLRSTTVSHAMCGEILPKLLQAERTELMRVYVERVRDIDEQNILDLVLYALHRHTTDSLSKALLIDALALPFSRDQMISQLSRVSVEDAQVLLLLCAEESTNLSLSPLEKKKRQQTSPFHRVGATQLLKWGAVVMDVHWKVFSFGADQSDQLRRVCADLRTAQQTLRQFASLNSQLTCLQSMTTERQKTTIHQPPQYTIELINL